MLDLFFLCLFVCFLCRRSLTLAGNVLAAAAAALLTAALVALRIGMVNQIGMVSHPAEGAIDGVRVKVLDRAIWIHSSRSGAFALNRVAVMNREVGQGGESVEQRHDGSICKREQ